MLNKLPWNVSLLYNYIFIINATIELIIATFSCDIWFIIFSLNGHFYPKCCLICFMQFFFLAIWNINLCKKVFTFSYSYMVTNHKFRIFNIFFDIKVDTICLALHFEVLARLIALLVIIYQQLFFLVQLQNLHKPRYVESKLYLDCFDIYIFVFSK